MAVPNRNVSFIINDSILQTMPANDNERLISFIKFLITSMPEWESVMIADWDRKMQYAVSDVWNFIVEHGMVDNND